MGATYALAPAHPDAPIGQTARVGVVPARAFGRRPRLLAALEAAYPVRFEAHDGADPGELDAVVVFGGGAPEAQSTGPADVRVEARTDGRGEVGADRLAGAPNDRRGAGFQWGGWSRCACPCARARPAPARRPSERRLERAAAGRREVLPTERARHGRRQARLGLRPGRPSGGAAAARLGGSRRA